MLLLGMVTSAFAADGQVSLANYLKDLAARNAIEVEGLTLIGNDTFKPPVNAVTVDKALARALNRYNYIVNYGDERIVRLQILGRKGNSVGSLPEEIQQIIPEEPPPPPSDDS
jgi:hypothetical protein